MSADGTEAGDSIVGSDASPRKWATTVAWSWGGALAFAATDAIQSAHADVDRVGSRAAVALGLFAFAAPWLLLAGLVVAPALHVLSGRRPAAQVPTAGSPDRRMAAPAALGLLFLLMYRSALAAGRADDRTLSTAVLALAVPLLAAVAWVAHAALVGILSVIRRRLARHPRLAFAACAALSAGVTATTTVGAVTENAAGLGALGAAWVTAPVAALVALAALARVVARRAISTRKLLATGGGLAVVGAVLVSTWEDLPRAAIGGRAWTGGIVHLLRTATDFDGDGYSSLLQGGDCAPFDDDVGPAAKDVPDDGVDQNCNGEDASSAVVAVPPRWFEDRLGLQSAANAVVVTIEAVRADRTSLLGHSRPTTPELSALAEKSATVFERTYAATSSTRLTIASLWSSRPPSTLPWERDGRARVPAFDQSAPWIPKYLSDAGFETMAVLPRWSGVLPREGRGYDRGFSTYDVSTEISVRGGEFHGTSARVIVDRAIELLDRRSRERFLLWIHLIEPHARYERFPGSPDFGDEDLDRYDTEIWGVDREVGRLVEALERRALLERTLVVVTGDHAEAFGEHGVATHATTVYDAETLTVGVLHVPGSKPRRVREPVVHHDFGPTLMNLLGVRKGFDELRGRNLIPALVGRRLERPNFIVEIFHSEHHRKYWAALVEGDDKLVYREDTQEYRLFDLARDPGEKHDVKDERADVYQRLRHGLVRFVDGESRRLPVAKKKPGSAAPTPRTEEPSDPPR